MTTQLELSNGVIVEVRKMAEQDMLRAASIFDPGKAERITADTSKANAADLLDLWRGNEKYLLYIVESSCTLMSELPTDDTWLGRYRRHADLYQIERDDLVYLEYKEAVYIRFIGMTTDEFVAAVTGVAMGNEDEPKKPAAAATPPRRRSRMAELTQNQD